MTEPTIYRIGPVDDPDNDTIWAQQGDDYLGVLVPVEPDPEDVVTEYLVKRGIPKDDAWMAAHHLIHTVLYCLSADSLTGIGGDDASHYPDDWYEAHGENQR